ncbi:outer membrane protein assembly factor BamB [Propionivibrio dicarboxylicus]|uniref:Outer membrane protein assembly factor BamB n=1 Tax=Propionivibrio dicarboxylicus TaxID=83767 RepID=A0A1G8MR86_9RHOO|nr:outer membrane protein assembly factor BamB [Propionivibrio dicarboxylicus]SDI70376.1 Beta-barrel assembly machine subunit BamB [Propionivibrio dicarboxylicus]
MKKYFVIACAATLLGGCSVLDAINPFSSSAPKMAELPSIKPTADARVVWRERVGKGDLYVFSPAVVGNSVYAAGVGGTVARIDDGKLVWKIDAGMPLSGGVGADEQLVVVGSLKGDVLAFNSADGKLVWKARATAEVLAPPAIGDGLVVVRSGDNRLAAFDTTDGKRKWIYQRPIPALSVRSTGAPIIDGKLVMAGFPGGKLIAVSPNNGAAVWEGAVALPKGVTELDRVADITSPPVISGRYICAVAYQGRVACFELGSGQQVWARDMSSALGLAIDGPTLFVTDDKGAVHALDLASGASLWKQDKLMTRKVSAPTVLRGFVVVADVEGVVHFLNREDGSFATRVKTDGSPVRAPIRSLRSSVVVQTIDGGVFAIEAE